MARYNVALEIVRRLDPKLVAKYEELNLQSGQKIEKLCLAHNVTDRERGQSFWKILATIFAVIFGVLFVLGSDVWNFPSMVNNTLWISSMILLASAFYFHKKQQKYQKKFKEVRPLVAQFVELTPFYTHLLKMINQGGSDEKIDESKFKIFFIESIREMNRVERNLNQLFYALGSENRMQRIVSYGTTLMMWEHCLKNELENLTKFGIAFDFEELKQLAGVELD